MINVVITGSTSFLGQYVVKELLKYSVNVFAIIRPQSQFAGIFDGYCNVSTILDDMNNVTSWSKKIDHIDYFIHLGWDGSGVQGRANQDLQNKNVTCAVDTFSVAQGLGCKSFLFTGSQAEYGIKNELITECSDCNPVTPYGINKLKVYKTISEMSKNSDVKYYHARVFSVYGVGDHPWTLMSTASEKFLNNESLKLTSCNQFWNYIYASDAAKEIVRLLFSNAPSGIYNIASDDTRPLKEFLFEMRDIFQSKSELKFGEHQPLESVTQLQPDISKLISVIGPMSFVPFKEGVEALIESVQE